MYFDNASFYLIGYFAVILSKVQGMQYKLLTVFSECVRFITIYHLIACNS